MTSMLLMRRSLWGWKSVSQTYCLGGADWTLPPAVTVPPPVLDKGPGKVGNTAKQDMSANRRIKKKTARNQGYQLAYFNLWWKRIDRKGQKDCRAKENREEVDKQIRKVQEYAGDHGDDEGNWNTSVVVGLGCCQEMAT